MSNNTNPTGTQPTDPQTPDSGATPIKSPKRQAMEGGATEEEEEEEE